MVVARIPNESSVTFFARSNFLSLLPLKTTRLMPASLVPSFTTTMFSFPYRRCNVHRSLFRSSHTVFACVVLFAVCRRAVISRCFLLLAKGRIILSFSPTVSNFLSVGVFLVQHLWISVATHSLATHAIWFEEGRWRIYSVHLFRRTTRTNTDELWRIKHGFIFRFSKRRDRIVILFSTIRHPFVL